MSCAQLVFFGSLSQADREQLMLEWREVLVQYDVKLSNEFKLERILSSYAAINNFFINKL